MFGDFWAQQPMLPYQRRVHFRVASQCHYCPAWWYYAPLLKSYRNQYRRIKYPWCRYVEYTHNNTRLLCFCFVYVLWLPYSVLHSNCRIISQRSNWLVLLPCLLYWVIDLWSLFFYLLLSYGQNLNYQLLIRSTWLVMVQTVELMRITTTVNSRALIRPFEPHVYTSNMKQQLFTIEGNWKHN